MTLKSLFATGFFSLAVTFGGVPAPAEERILNDPDPTHATTYNAETQVVETAVEGGKALQIKVNGSGKNPWDAGLVLPLKSAVIKGEALELAIWARVSASAGSQSVTVPVGIGLAEAPWTGLFGQPVTIESAWKRLVVRGQSDGAYPAGKLQATIHVGGIDQTIEFGPIQVTSAGVSTRTSAANPTVPARPASALDGFTAEQLASMIANDPTAPDLSSGKASLIPDSAVQGGKALRVQVPEGAKDQAWKTTLTSPIVKPVKAGDRLVLLFSARLEKAPKGSATSTLPWNSVQMNAAPWTSVLGGSAELKPDWQTFEFTGNAESDFAARKLEVKLQLASAKQTLDLGPVLVFNLGHKP